MRRKLPLLLALLLAVAACGDDSPPAAEAATTAPVTSTATTAAPTTAAPTVATTASTTTAAPSTTVAPRPTTEPPPAFPVVVAGTTIESRPERIVSLSSTSTEILFAIGAGDQVVAVDSFSDYPEEAPTTGLEAFNASVEAVAEFAPDLVVLFYDPLGEIASGLELIGIPVITHLAALGLDDVYRQIDELGTATGNSQGAASLIAEMQATIDETVARFADVAPDSPLTYYHEVDNTLYSATSASFVGSIYGLFGMTSIADPADTAGAGFPQLNAEYIIEADPDVIFFGCAVWCGTTAESIAERPGWSAMRAVQTGAVIEVDDDITSRWGPRIVQFVERVGEALQVLLEG